MKKKMENKKIIVLLFLTIVFLNFISADLVNFYCNSQGITLGFKDVETIPLNQNYTFSIHIYNDTYNGAPLTNSSAFCALHLYDLDGKHLIANNKIDFGKTPYDFYLHIDKGNFTKIGDYPYVIACFSDDLQQSGSCSSSLHVTLDGTIPSVTSYIFLVLFAVLLIIFTIWINFIFNASRREKIYNQIVTSYFNSKSNGENNLGKVILYTLGYGLLKNIIVFYYLGIVFLLFVLTEFVVAFNIQSMVTLFSTFLSISLWGFILVFIVFIFNLYELIKNLIHDVADTMWKGVQ